MLTWPDAQHIYLSPHLDDAVLSCGGMIFQQAQRGESIAVITACAGSPPLPMVQSPIVQELHARWAASSPERMAFADPPAARRAEDLRALAELGTTIQAIHLDMLDCIYRVHPGSGGALYATGPSINAEVQPDDPLTAQLDEAAPLHTKATLYVPLAVGRHVDHQVVRRAAEGWGIAPRQMVYYEDYPYAGEPGAIEAVVSESAGWTSQAIPLGAEALKAKIMAVARYESQITTFWMSVAAMADAVRGFAAARGGERLWVRNARNARR